MKALGKTYAEINSQTKTATLNLTGFVRGVADQEITIEVLAHTPAKPKYRLPAPRPLRVGQYAEHHGGRPFLDARISRGWWIWKRFEDVDIFRSGAK